MMFRKLFLTTALGLLSLPLCGGSVEARENYALLIGASEYQNLAEKWWLKGPKNDVALAYTYLTTEAPVPFAEDNVIVLADGLEGIKTDGHATLAEIRAAFARLEAELQPGDFVYLHFSGHGTQAPAADPDSELDGLDEMFLPVDIGDWNDGVGQVENSLVDDEIGRLIDSLRARGADVWVVFDSCHSGTATRDVAPEDEDVAVRQLDPSVLGVPELTEEAQSRGVGGGDPRAAPEAPVDATDEKKIATADGVEPGALVAFFAAQTNEVTPEKRLPKGKPDRKPQGVFTYTLFQTLAEYPNATYGQIAQEVLRKYAVGNLAKSTPLFEGDLDQVVFEAEPGGRVAQWPAEVTDAGITIPAGELHGLSQGAVLAVMESAAATTDKAIGYVEIASLDTFTATVVPVEKDGKTLPAELPKGLYLRKLDEALDFSLTVALPPEGSAPADALLAALEELKAESGPRLNFVAAGAEADLRLAVLPDSGRPDAIWVLPSTGLAEDLATTPSVTTADKTGDELAVTLADTLNHMAKALNLMKLGAAVGTGDLDVDVQLQTRTPEDRKLRELPFSPVPTLITDDEVHVLARNNNDFPVDVNVLYIGADNSISHWFSGRLQPGDELKKGLFAIGDGAVGQERLIVVVTPAKPHSPVEDLSYLAQDALETNRGLGETSLGAAFTEAGFGETTRSAVALSDEGEEAGPAPMILQMELRTKAAD
jgi:hypothetical protein